MKPVRLILADLHPLEPFIVRSHQFSCRATSFARHWPGPVELWLPGPTGDAELVHRRTGAATPENFRLVLGPSPFVSLLGWRIASRDKFRRWCRRRMNQLASQGETCLFYFRTLKFADALLPTHRQLGWKYAFEPHEVFHQTSTKPDKLRVVEERVYHHAAMLFPISHALKQQLSETLPVNTPAHVGPLGHTGVNFAVPEYDPAAKPEFLYIGSLHGWKGLETAFAATAGLGLPFHVVGDAGGLERCRTFCRQNTFDHVNFHGEIPPEQVARFYSPGCICLLPLSNQEIARFFTSPLKIFDYMAAGRPIAAGDVPTIRELLVDGENARLAPVGDVPTWRRVLEELLRDRLAAARLASNARQLARSCTWDERAKPLVTNLRTLI